MVVTNSVVEFFLHLVIKPFLIYVSLVSLVCEPTSVYTNNKKMSSTVQFNLGICRSTKR